MLIADEDTRARRALGRAGGRRDERRAAERFVVGEIFGGHPPAAQDALGAPNLVARIANIRQEAGRGIGVVQRAPPLELLGQPATMERQKILLMSDLFLARHGSILRNLP